MNAKKFNQIVQELHDSCKSVLSTRAEVYADKDRFRNFKKVALIKGTDKYDALLGMFLKHFEAWMNFMEKPVKETPMLQWEEKTVDMINYLTICLGMVIEDFENEKGE